uniref:Uncharacterized protein n=1 Tax=Arundo donax TaxID=35708 RepID=A0A0A9BTA1_ARUDO
MDKHAQIDLYLIRGTYHFTFSWVK